MPRNVGVVVVSKLCPVCSKACDTEVEADRFYRWRNGAYVQDVWPTSDPAWREQLISGTHPECWEWMFPEMMRPDEEEL